MANTLFDMIWDAPAGTGYAVEFSGAAVYALDREGRMTVCNLSIELGARMGIIAHDATTFTDLEGREFAPCGAQLAQAIASWQ